MEVPLSGDFDVFDVVGVVIAVFAIVRLIIA